MWSEKNYFYNVKNKTKKNILLNENNFIIFIHANFLLYINYNIMWLLYQLQI